MIKNLKLKQEVMNTILSVAHIIEDARKEKNQLEVNRSTVIHNIGAFMVHAIDDRIAKLQDEINYWMPKLIEKYSELDDLNGLIMYAEDMMERQRYNNRQSKRQRLIESMMDKNERMIG